jgi:hypothetical protein
MLRYKSVNNFPITPITLRIYNKKDWTGIDRLLFIIVFS